MSDNEIDNITNSINKIKIKIGDNFYHNLMKKYNIPKRKLPLTDDERIEEYLVVLDILDKIDKIESGINSTPKEIDKVIEYSLAKTMQYKRIINFHPSDPHYKYLSNKAKNIHIDIGNIIDNNVLLLRNKSINKNKKIREIKKLNRKMVIFVNQLEKDELQDINEINDIRQKLKHIKIKK